MRAQSWLELELKAPTEMAEDLGALLIEDLAAGVELVEEDDELTKLLVAYDLPEEMKRESAEVPLEILEHVERQAEILGLTFTPDDLKFTWRADQDWRTAWQKFFKPLLFGKNLWIVPSFAKDFEQPEEAVVLNLDPGMAFGTGQHATTALCLDFLAAYLTPLTAAVKEQLSVLDVGCGSGILALAALKLGVGKALGIDNDPEALEVARENRTKNTLEVALELSQQPLAEITGTYGLIVANILYSTLVELAPDLARLVKTAPTPQILLLSGILNSQVAELSAVYRKQGLEVVGVKQREDWSLIQLTVADVA